MRLLPFARTAIVILINVSACFGATSHTRRDERTNPRNASEGAATNDTVPTRANAIDGVHANSKISFNGKNEEARMMSSGAVHIPAGVHVIDPDIKKGETIAKLSSELQNKLELGTQVSTENIAKVMEHDHWTSMEKEMDDWLLEQHVNPKTVFSYMQLESVFNQNMDIVTMSHDPKLLLWFRYIIEYRRMDSTGPNLAAFDDKKLLKLLVEQLKARNSKYSTSLHDNPLSDPRSQVVTLFELYRHEPSMKSFAGDMLTYMVTDSVTKDHVLNVWLQKEESPIAIFSVLHLNNEHGRIDLDDMTVFTAWLDYVKMYLQSGASNFRVGDIIFLQLSMMSVPRARAMFESNALEHVLGDVEHETGNLATYLRDLWERFPFHIFNNFGLLGEKIESSNRPKFLEAISFVATYMDTMPFDGDVLYDLLKPAHSFAELKYLFKNLDFHAKNSEDLLVKQRYSDIEKFAGNMREYFDEFSRLRFELSEMEPEEYLKLILEKGANTELLTDWFRHSIDYYAFWVEKSEEEAISIVIRELHAKVVTSDITPNMWLTVINQMRGEDARINSVWTLVESTLRSPVRKRKRGT